MTLQARPLGNYPAIFMGSDIRIPFNKPTIVGAEFEYMRQAVLGGHSSAKGPYSKDVTELLRYELGASEILLTTSCTAALELSALMLDIQPGDKVIVPSFTFVTTALAYVRAGARLVFADIEEATLGIDPDHVADLVDERTRAVVPVHYAGVACDLSGLSESIGGFPIDIIEDNAHGLFGSLDGQPLGSFGRFATLSFHETKNFVCGEGGALVVNRPEDVARAHTLYDKGTNRRAFMLGQVDKYSWVDQGSSFGLSDILAAYLLAQLQEKESILKKRRALFDCYKSALEPYQTAFGFSLPQIPIGRVQGFHMFYVLMPDRESRDRSLRYLNGNGFKATFHYVPLHSAPAAKDYVAMTTDCPVTESISGRLIRLPFYNDLSHADAEAVADCLLDSFER